jgi:predicted DNA-binding protein
MPYHKKQFSREPKKARSRRRDEQALTNVVSLRISDREKRLLEKITKSTSMNVSEVVREAIDLWLARRQKFCLDA